MPARDDGKKERLRFFSFFIYLFILFIELCHEMNM